MFRAAKQSSRLNLAKSMITRIETFQIHSLSSMRGLKTPISRLSFHYQNNNEHIHLGSLTSMHYSSLAQKYDPNMYNNNNNNNNNTTNDKQNNNNNENNNNNTNDNLNKQSTINIINNNSETDRMKGLHSSNRMREREKIGDIIEGNVPNLQIIKHPHVAKDIEHAREIYDINTDYNEHYTLPHPIWSESQVNNIEITHMKPTKLADYLAYGTVQTLRFIWDFSTGYIFGKKLKLFNFSYNLWLLRIVYLETVAGVPGMMFGMVRHLNSLRNMKRDHGWIHTLLSEAENERMHLLTFLKLYQPSKLFRYCVVSAQFIMSNFLFISYLISPRFCHKFVGYLEEEAVMTYTGLLEDINAGKLPEFNEKASKIARGYWQLNKDATWKDVILQVRADEAHHREVNHTLAPLSQKLGSSNPFRNEY